MPMAGALDIVEMSECPDRRRSAWMRRYNAWLLLQCQSSVIWGLMILRMPAYEHCAKLQKFTSLITGAQPYLVASGARFCIENSRKIDLQATLVAAVGADAVHQPVAS